MATEIYIGNVKADYNGEVNCEFSCSDFRELNSGNNNTSYTIDLPLTRKNSELLSFASQISTITETNITGRIMVNDTEIIRGNVQVLSMGRYNASILISKDDWLAPLEAQNITEIDFSAYNHNYTSANVLVSWTAAAGAFYRYPLINFGKHFDGAADWTIYDFVPWFHVKTIMEKIMGITLEGDFYSGAFFNSLYIMGKEFIADAAFLSLKAMIAYVAADTDNKTATAITGTGVHLILNKYPVVIKSETIDEATAYNTGTYRWVCPESGTYRMKFTADVYFDPNGNTIGALSRIINIMKNGVSLINWTSSTIVTGDYSQIITTDYQYFAIGDYVDASFFHDTTFSVATGSTATIYLRANTTILELLTMDNRCLRMGRDFPVDAAKFMPEITDIDFVKGLKEAFNLKFFYDQWNKKLLFEPGDQWPTTKIKDISLLIDYSEIGQENISSNYAKTIYLEWLDDNNDVALQNYQEANKTKAYRKKITMSSVLAMGETEHYENSVFSTFIKSRYNTYAPWGVLQPMIWGDYDKTVYTYPQERGYEFGVKLGQWMGNTAGVSFTYEGVAKTSYPKMDPIDMAVMYTSYFMKTMHYIDAGKLITVQGKARQQDIIEFTTVVSDKTKEAFRTLYQFSYQGESHLGILNRYTTDGITCKLELLLVI